MIFSGFRAVFLIFPYILLLAACGGGGTGVSPTPSPNPPPPPPPPPAITIQLSGAVSVSLAPGAQQQFTAVVKGTSNTAVTWSVDGVAGGNTNAGQVTSAGLYTAPSLAGSHTVASASVADPTKIAKATVTVETVTVAPNTAGVEINATQQFTATVQDAANATVVWSVDGVAGGNAGTGTIDALGLYTAPAQPGSHMVAASIANPAISASAPVSVYSIAVTPTGTLLGPATTQQFTAATPGLTNAGVNWSVDGIAGGNSSVGIISAQGLYTAPSALGMHTISASVVINPSGTATTALTVVNTSPGAVLTYHNDDARDGAFTVETTLMPSVVNSTQFGKLRSYPVDGQMYAQPLYVPHLAIGGTKHNVVFAATENDTVYAFDADGTQTNPLWSVSVGVASPRNDLEASILFSVLQVLQ